MFVCPFIPRTLWGTTFDVMNKANLLKYNLFRSCFTFGIKVDSEFLQNDFVRIRLRKTTECSSYVCLDRNPFKLFHTQPSISFYKRQTKREYLNVVELNFKEHTCPLYQFILKAYYGLFPFIEKVKASHQSVRRLWGLRVGLLKETSLSDSL